MFPKATPQDGIAWALYKSVQKSAGIENVPVADKCEECFVLHGKYFKPLSWDKVIAMHDSDDDDMKKKVQSARDCHRGTADGPDTKDEVGVTHSTKVVIGKTYMILDEAEMRKVTEKNG